MEATKILDYISHENADHSKNRYTEIIYNNGSITTAHLFKNDQIDIQKSLRTNLWVLRTIYGELIELDGTDIKSLRVGR